MYIEIYNLHKYIYFRWSLCSRSQHTPKWVCRSFYGNRQRHHQYLSRKLHTLQHSFGTRSFSVAMQIVNFLNFYINLSLSLSLHKQFQRSCRSSCLEISGEILYSPTRNHWKLFYTLAFDAWAKVSRLGLGCGRGLGGALSHPSWLLWDKECLPGSAAKGWCSAKFLFGWDS